MWNRLTNSMSCSFATLVRAIFYARITGIFDAGCFRKTRFRFAEQLEIVFFLPAENAVQIIRLSFG
jgi:hypothetical protein